MNYDDMRSDLRARLAAAMDEFAGHAMTDHVIYAVRERMRSVIADFTRTHLMPFPTGLTAAQVRTLPDLDDALFQQTLGVPDDWEMWVMGWEPVVSQNASRRRLSVSLVAVQPEFRPPMPVTP